MSGEGGDTGFGAGVSVSRVHAIYAAWFVIVVVSLLAGGYTLGFLVDAESIGTLEDPNSMQVVEEWSGFTLANDGDFSNDDGDFSNDDGDFSNDGTANTQSIVTADGVFGCELNSFCSAQFVVPSLQYSN